MDFEDVPQGFLEGGRYGDWYIEWPFGFNPNIAPDYWGNAMQFMGVGQEVYAYPLYGSYSVEFKMRTTGYNQQFGFS